MSESLEQPGRRRRSKRRFSSLTNLTDLAATGKKASGGRRRRNSISLDDIQNLKRFAAKDLDLLLNRFSLAGRSVEAKTAGQEATSLRPPLEPARSSLSTLEPVPRRKSSGFIFFALYK